MSTPLLKTRFLITTAHYRLFCGFIFLSATFPTAFAEENKEQQTSANTTVLEKVVISGEKTLRSLQHTTSSVTAISGKSIEEKPAIATLSDLLKGAPNVLYTNESEPPIIRGIDTKGPVAKGNAYLANPIPRATISVDGRYLSAGEFGLGAAPIWDVESVEVFRGPQTTTQGANAIAGAIVINTKDPTFTPEAELQTLYGTREEKRGSLMASGPLTEQLAGRVALDYSGRDTFIKYTNPQFMDGDMDNDPRNVNGRVKLLWKPSELPGFEGKLTYSHMDVKKPAFEIASHPYHLNHDTRDSTDYIQTKTDAGILDLKYDLGNTIVLFNELQYSSGDYSYNFGKAFAGTATKDYDNVANEFRVNFGDETTTLSGLGGVFYSKSKSKNNLLNLYASSDFTIDQDSVGVFSELTYRFAEKWALTGGLRYQYDGIRHDGVASYVPGVRHIYDDSFDAVLPKISLSYDILDDVTVGVMASRGYLPGGTGLNFYGKRYYYFDAEKAWNYEIFSRINVLDSKLSLTPNIFYTRYTDAQRSVTDYIEGKPWGSVIVNADEAKAYGVEMGADYQLLDNLLLRGGVGILRTEINKFGDMRGNVFNGKDFAKAPGYMFNVGADWDVIEKFRVSGDVRFTDDYYSTDDNDPALRVGSYAIANMQISYKPNENMEIFGYAKNLFDERVPTEKNLDRVVGVQAYMTEPRSFGVGLKTKF